MLLVNHKSPAFVCEEILFTGTVDSINNEFICSIESKVGTLIIATGKRGQKIVETEKLRRLFKIEY